MRIALRHWLLAATLAPMASCVMQDEGIAPRRVALSRPLPPRQLLQGLALATPDLALQSALIPADASPARSAAPAFQAIAASTDDADRARDCLTAAIYYEARSESVDGQRAVAQVVLNRVRDRAFPASVCGVVYQGSTRSTGCQFSFTCDGSMAYRRDERAWARARAIAAAALAGDVYTPVGAATFYHANYVHPWWAPSMAAIGSIGSHIFYRWRTSMERALSFRQSYSGVEPQIGGGPLVIASAAAVPMASVAAAFVSVERGVTVHRNGGDAAPAEAPAPALRTVAGVRIHIGADAMPVDPAP